MRDWFLEEVYYKFKAKTFTVEGYNSLFRKNKEEKVNVIANLF